MRCQDRKKTLGDTLYNQSLNHVGESGHTPGTFSLDVVCLATIQVRRTANAVAVGPRRGLHNYRKTSQFIQIAKEGEMKMSDHVKNPKVPHQWDEVGQSFIQVQ